MSRASRRSAEAAHRRENRGPVWRHANAWRANRNRDNRFGVQTFSKPFPSFLQIFGGFLQAFPNFCLAVLGDSRGLGGQKFGERPFRFSPNFLSPPGTQFLHRGAPTPTMGRTKPRFSFCQTAGTQPITSCEKQKESFDFRFLLQPRRPPPRRDRRCIWRWGAAETADGWAGMAQMGGLRAFA